MLPPKTFVSETKRLTAISQDPAVTVKSRIMASCNLFRLYQNDVQNQARCVTRIEELVKHLP